MTGGTGHFPLRNDGHFDRVGIVRDFEPNVSGPGGSLCESTAPGMSGPVEKNNAVDERPLSGVGMTVPTDSQQRMRETRAFFSEIDTLQTQFDVFRLLKRVCDLFEFSAFMVLRLPEPSHALDHRLHRHQQLADGHARRL